MEKVSWTESLDCSKENPPKKYVPGPTTCLPPGVEPKPNPKIKEIYTGKLPSVQYFWTKVIPNLYKRFFLNREGFCLSAVLEGEFGWRQSCLSMFDWLLKVYAAHFKQRRLYLTLIQSVFETVETDWVEGKQTTTYDQRPGCKYVCVSTTKRKKPITCKTFNVQYGQNQFLELVIHDTKIYTYPLLKGYMSIPMEAVHKDEHGPFNKTTRVKWVRPDPDAVYTAYQDQKLELAALQAQVAHLKAQLAALQTKKHHTD